MLGLSSGTIQDWQIASSSTLNSAEQEMKMCQPKYGRLYQNGNKAWCSKHLSVGEWILVDLGVLTQVPFTINLLICLLNDNCLDK